MAALPEDFLIRSAKIEDTGPVAALEAELFTDPWPPHIYQQEVSQPLRFQRVILTPMGQLAAYLFACWQVDELHILKVATHPIYQGQGLATLLMNEAHQEAIKNRGLGLILEVRPSNRRAINIYRHLGYHIIGRRPRYYTDGEDALVMYLTVVDTPPS